MNDTHDSRIKITESGYARATRIKQIMARIVDHLRRTTRAENGVVIIGLDEARTHAWMTTAKR